MRKIVILLLLLCMHFSARGQAQYEYCYWFDGEISTVEKGSTTSDAWRMEVDLSHLTEGFHTIHLQVIDEKGVSSTPVTRCFYLSREEGALKNGYYWFDDETKVRNVESNIHGTVTFDVTELPEGFHTLHYQVLREDGLYSQTESRSFYKVKSELVNEQLIFMCHIDGIPFKKERVSAENGETTWLVDVAELPIGFHKLQIRVITENGASTSIHEAFFLRNIMDSELEALSCIFSIDGVPYKTIENGVNDGVFHCDLDVASLTEGLHNITYYLTNKQGAQTAVKTQYFVKQPIGGNSIKKYQYWVNEHDDMAHTIIQDNATDSLHLIRLLPVEQQPLRSKSFHFEVKDDHPIIYAKNTFHVRFFDAASRYTDADDDYIDYAVSQELTGIDEIVSGIRETIDMPVENAIKWYKLDAERGDSLCFRVDKACTIQLFAPSGAEVYNVYGSSSVEWGGLHAKETGTYYLALHDVTATKGTTMNVDYEHIDKYAVLRQDVAVVGNGGASIITYEGNGFGDLYNVFYINSTNDTIKSAIIDHVDQATVSVVFDFTRCSLGTYKAVFCFTEGHVILENNLRIEDAKEISLSIKESHPKRYLRDRTVTYTVEITNHGNMTANRVPMFVFFASKSSSGVSHVDIEGLKLPALVDYFDRDSLTDIEWNELKEFSKELGDLHYFQELEGINSDGDSTSVYCGIFYVSIAPNTTKTIKLKLKGNEWLEAWFSMPESWDPLCIDSLSSTRLLVMRKMPAKCWLQLGALTLDVVSLGCDIGLLIYPGNPYLILGGLVTSSLSMYLNCLAGEKPDAISVLGLIANYSTSTAYGLGKLKIIGNHKKYLDLFAENKKMNVAQTFLDLYTTIGDFIATLPCKSQLDTSNINKINYTSGNGGTGVNKKRNAPRKASGGGCGGGGGGGSTDPVNSLDPNDIYGYEAESGSRFVGDSITALYYRIEFENDATFATAAAHVVEVKDTLDRNVFDLASYTPTSIKIGDKTEYLSGTPEFVRTIDMRPAINAIAQVEGKFDERNGIATWLFTSLDPMTMEPTDDVMQGFLPVNYDGISGIGEITYDISRKAGLPDGTGIKNRASIVFDTNEAILTPTWINIVDTVAPISTIGDFEVENDTILRVNVNGYDERSGIWKYELYVQHGVNAPWWKEGETDSTSFNFRFYEDVDYGFCVLATDSAGNMEKKIIRRERGFKAHEGDYEDTINELPTTTIISEGKFDLSGRKVGRKAKGIIIRKSNGTSRKVMIK